MPLLKSYLHRIVLFCLFMLSGLMPFAQSTQKIHYVHLTPHDHHAIRQFPYRKVIVLDNRLDTTKIGIYYKGKDLAFDRPASQAIHRYISDMTSRFAKADRDLLLNITRLYCGQEVSEGRIMPFFRFSASAFMSVGNNDYARLVNLNIKMYYQDRTMDNTLRNIMDEVITRISRPKRKTTTDTLAFEAINQPVRAGWQQYAINNNSPYSSTCSGYYTSFAALRSDAITDYSLKMMMQRDSTYSLVYPNTTDYVRDRFTDRIWAVTDIKGATYIHLGENIFLPLQHHDNTFYFRIPGNLSEEHLNIMIKSLPKAVDTTGNAGNDFGSGCGNGIGSTSGGNGGCLEALVIVGAIVFVAGTVLVVKAIVTHSKNKDKYKTARVFNTSRESVLDMDTGDIVYY